MARIADDTDIRSTLQKHASAIGSLSTKVDAIEHKLSEHGSALSRIEMAVTRQDATRPPSHKETVGLVREYLTIGLMLSTVLGGVIIAIVKPELITFGERNRQHEDRMARIERSLDELARRPLPEPKIVYRTAPAK